MLKIEEPNSIRILDDKKSSIKRFDHVFWSCDGYKKRDDGYLEPDGPQSSYADQVNFKNMELNNFCTLVFINTFRGVNC